MGRRFGTPLAAIQAWEAQLRQLQDPAWRAFQDPWFHGADGGGWIHGRSARRRVGSHRVLPMCSGGHLVAAAWGGDCSVWFGAWDISLDRALERAPRAKAARAKAKAEKRAKKKAKDNAKAVA